MALSDNEYHALLNAARANGEHAGDAAGSWIIDGNTSDASCRQLLDMIDVGDPEFYDMIPNPLFGEWADGATLDGTIGDAMDAADTPDTYNPADLNEIERDEVLGEFEGGFVDGFTGRVYSDAQSRLA